MKRAGGSSSASLQKLFTVDMFRSRTKTGKREAKNLLFPLASRLTNDDIIERPRWLDAMEKVNPARTDSFVAEKPGKIVYPEDKLIRAYYNRRPLAKLEAIDMHAGDSTFSSRREENVVNFEETSSSSSNSSNSRHFVRQFALRQLEYMNQIAQPLIRTKKYPNGRKYTEEEARALVEKEAEEERRLLARNREGDENPFVPTLISKIKVNPNLLEEINEEEESYWKKNKETRASNQALGLGGRPSVVGRFSRGNTRRKREERERGSATASSSSSSSSSSSKPSSASSSTTTTTEAKVDV
jgi:hypothetical protein